MGYNSKIYGFHDFFLFVKYENLTAAEADHLRLLPVIKWTVLASVLNVATIVGKTATIPQLLVLSAFEFREAPLLRDVDLLTTGELELRTAQSFDDLRLVAVAGTNAHDGLTDADTGNSTLRFAVRSSHSSLEPISSSTGQHLIDAKNVEGMQSHTNVELILTTVFHQVFVAANTTCLQRFRAELFILIRHQVHT